MVATWSVRDPRGDTHTSLVAIDVETGNRRTLVDEAGVDYTAPVISPDGALVAAGRVVLGDFDTPGTLTVCVHDLAGGSSRSFELIEELAQWEHVWSPDSSILYVAGDRRGRGAIIALEVATGAHRRIVSDAVYTSLSVSPDGTAIYALRSAIDCPPQPVRLDARAPDAAPTFLPSPAPRPALPGTLVEVEAIAPDGATVRGWRRGASSPAAAVDPRRPARLVQHLVVEAVPLAVGRAWLGGADARPCAVGRVRPGLDRARLAAPGGAGVAGRRDAAGRHTDRFKAIVSHSGNWAVDQAHATTDLTAWNLHLFGTPAEHPDWYAENSPHHFADAITTPMLIIHGNRDYRVPYSESLRAFWDLVRHHGGDPATLAHRFLQFTGRNHFLSPGNARIWNQTVLAFLEWHVLDGKWSPLRLA